MTYAPNENEHGWPARLRLSDLHQSEIVGWMQDEHPENELNHPGEYTRADLAHPMTVAEAAALEAAYLAGFNASHEGYNGEYPFQDNDTSPTTDAGWVKRRDAALRALSQGGE